MRAYARIRTRDDFRPLHLARGPVFTMEAALERMRGMLGTAVGWAELSAWLPDEWKDAPERRRSATAGELRGGAGAGEGGPASSSARRARSGRST